MQYTSSNTPHKYKANKQTKKNTIFGNLDIAIVKIYVN